MKTAGTQCVGQIWTTVPVDGKKLTVLIIARDSRGVLNVVPVARRADLSSQDIPFIVKPDMGVQMGMEFSVGWQLMDKMEVELPAMEMHRIFTFRMALNEGVSKEFFRPIKSMKDRRYVRQDKMLELIHKLQEPLLRQLYKNERGKK